MPNARIKIRRMNVPATLSVNHGKESTTADVVALQAQRTAIVLWRLLFSKSVCTKCQQSEGRENLSAQMQTPSLGFCVFQGEPRTTGRLEALSHPNYQQGTWPVNMLSLPRTVPPARQLHPPSARARDPPPIGGPPFDGWALRSLWKRDCHCFTES